MGLTTMFGKYDGTDAGNSQALCLTFENAANTATRYGFSPEEGMEQVRQAVEQGLCERRTLDAARDVFVFKRGTGTDGGVLSEFRNLTERFSVSGASTRRGRETRRAGCPRRSSVNISAPCGKRLKRELPRASHTARMKSPGTLPFFQT
ncbi:MAG: hypothetical protein LBF77_06665 [Spirochaetaceae bacterium]|nr:hypothetical protein [Spirochaetaceae bacterium]